MCAGLDDNDLDKELPEKELGDLKAAFHARYKVKYGIQIEPGDQLVSRLSRELTRRQLQVHAVFKVRSLVHQLKAPRKRQKIGEGLELVCDERDDSAIEPQRDLATYLALHQTLMLAFAKAGVGMIDPAPTEPETVDRDPTDYVIVPLDVVMSYHHRVVRCAGALPPHMALDWIQRKDEEERQIWADKHRASAYPLGKIIKDLLERREWAWELPRVEKVQATSARVPPPPPQGV